jgi:hypothetical protein
VLVAVVTSMLLLPASAGASVPSGSIAGYAIEFITVLKAHLVFQVPKASCNTYASYMYIGTAMDVVAVNDTGAVVVISCAPHTRVPTYSAMAFQYSNGTKVTMFPKLKISPGQTVATTTIEGCKGCNSSKSSATIVDETTGASQTAKFTAMVPSNGGAEALFGIFCATDFQTQGPCSDVPNFHAVHFTHAMSGTGPGDTAPLGNYSPTRYAMRIPGRYSVTPSTLGPSGGAFTDTGKVIFEL